MGKFLAGVLLLSGLPSIGQVSPAGQPVLRYHYGDDPAWAAPSLDDAQWPTSPSGVIPAPAADSDGFLWVRISFQVPPSTFPTTSPPTLRLTGLSDYAGFAELFADGSPIGHWGAPPPHPQVWFTPPRSLFPLGKPSLAPESAVLIAARIWVAPQMRGLDEPLHPSFSIDPTPIAVLTDGYVRQKIFLSELPGYAICFFVALLGLALAGISFVVRRRVFVLSAMLLLSTSATEVFLEIAYSGIRPLTSDQFGAMYFVLMLLASLCMVEFIWDSLALGCRPVKYLAFAGAFLDSAAVAIAWIVVIHRPAFAHFPIEDWGSYLRNLLEVGGALWGLFFRPGRRVLAAVLLLAGAVPTVLFYFKIYEISIGSFNIQVLSISLLLTGCCVTGIMAADAWSARRNAAELQFQFSAARELQQQLVPVSVPGCPGLKIEAAYLPATEVGGDFYQVLPLADGATLIAVGDVSGKGLKAAMTGTLAIGALRTLARENLSPAAILSRLNDEIVEAQQDGFITCLCVRIGTAGNITLANAGHLAPYRAGEECRCEPGLPLGLLRESVYPETALQLNPGDTLTLLTDGVLEARSKTGELFGFDRTAAISNQSAEAIAKAAQDFGQEDDITVLTLRYAPA